MHELSDNGCHNCKELNTHPNMPVCHSCIRLNCNGTWNWKPVEKDNETNAVQR